MVVNVVPLVLPRTDSVWVRAPHEAGSCRTMRLALWAEPRSTWTHWGNALFALSQYVLWLPSVTLLDGYTSVWLDSLVGLPAARSVGTVPWPVPERATVVGLFVALLVMVRVPVRAPAAVGRKLTLTVQDAPAAIEVPQELVWLKSPVTETPDTDAAAVPVLVTVTVCAALVVLSAWVAKVSDEGLVLNVASCGGCPPLG